MVNSIMDNVHGFFEIVQGKSGVYLALNALQIEEDGRCPRRHIGRERQEQAWAAVSEADQQTQPIL